MSRLRTTAAWTAVGLLVVVVVALVGWRLHGGRWVRVETPSMGTQAPVGTLLWVAPVRVSTLHPGDLITFRAPSSGRTYSHLVAAVHPDGTLSTRGRITAEDPWRLRPADVQGKVVMRWRGVGWLVLAAPALVLGGLLLWSVCRRLRERDLRLPVAVVGSALVVAAALVAYQPLTGAEQLGFAATDTGARATYVSTGLLPIRLQAAGARSVRLGDGEVGTVVARRPVRAAAGERFEVSVRPAVPRALWPALVAICFAPAACASWADRRRRDLVIPVPKLVPPVSR